MTLSFATRSHRTAWRTNRPMMALGGAIGAMHVAAAFAIATGNVARAEVPTGGVYVTTLPSGADVWVDGNYLGRSPLVVDALSEGRHTLAIAKVGWTSAQIDLTISDGILMTSSTRLVPAAHASAVTTAVGSLVLRDASANDAITIDGLPLAAGTSASARTTLAAGTHRLGFATPRGRTARTITIFPDMPTTVILHERVATPARSPVIAAAEDYLPTDAFVVEGNRIVVRYLSHVVVAHIGDRDVRFDGTTLAFDGAPETIGGKLYMPLRLLEKITGDINAK